MNTINSTKALSQTLGDIILVTYSISQEHLFAFMAVVNFRRSLSRYLGHGVEDQLLSIIMA